MSEPLQNGQGVGKFDSKYTYAQHDAIPCTWSRVKFNRDTNMKDDLSNQSEYMKEKIWSLPHKLFLVKRE